MTIYVWVGQMTDDRVIGAWEDLPIDAPPKPRWKRAWLCDAKVCRAPKGVTCKCKDKLS